ncbi:MAG: hypothetical protein QOF65_406 [Thermoleophilaceae bacterium]|jgi:hypothetical protein|nr:hypothetical protein [Thermoleophilaceae bacterium]MEA2435850.1 hypothetical protein [Thermoleophilaceae bacterium]
MPLSRSITRTILLVGLILTMSLPRERRRDRARLWCERCNRVWASSIYLPDGPHNCPLCHNPLVARAVDEPSAEDDLPSFWDVRLHSHDRIGHQPPRPADVRVVFETLELLLDGMLSSNLSSEDELGRRAAWADFVLRRAFSGLAEDRPPVPEQRGPEEMMRRGARVWAALDQSSTGREAALAIAGLPPDDLRAALLAAALDRVKTYSPDGAEKWLDALSGFTEWWRPQDLL